MAHDALDHLGRVGLEATDGQDNPKRSLSLVDELEDRCAARGKAPGIGTARPERGEGIRMLPHGRAPIFDRQIARSVGIDRVVHSSRDIGEDDFGPA